MEETTVQDCVAPRSVLAGLAPPTVTEKIPDSDLAMAQLDE
jgi:hypothetical protein